MPHRRGVASAKGLGAGPNDGLGHLDPTSNAPQSPAGEPHLRPTFGSLGKGDGDASLNLFGEESAPNQRAGVRPLTQFDSYAAPMVASFARSANTNPYTAVRPDQAGEIVNGTDAPMARASQAQRLDREDQINERTFNEAIWKNVRGERSAMPAPRHTLWGAVPNAVEDDD